MSQIKENILATLAYFDLFNYPLTSAEINLFLKNKCVKDEFDEVLTSLVNSKKVYQLGKLYSLKNDYSLAVRRYNGNSKAAQLIKVAEKASNFLIRFPYVRGVGISGSLSKNFADENSDIDFFIITASNRLWIARTIMHAFKKLTFLVNKQDYFCMNYYIDEQQLEIIEKTTYTAIEIVTLIPLHGKDVFEQFYIANAWTQQYLPNKIIHSSFAKPLKNSFFKLIIETAFNNTLGEAVDNMLMKITAGRWLKKTVLKKLNSKGTIMSMDANKHYAKPDPKKFQDTLLQQYDHKIADILRDAQKSPAN